MVQLKATPIHFPNWSRMFPLTYSMSNRHSLVSSRDTILAESWIQVPSLLTLRTLSEKEETISIFWMIDPRVKSVQWSSLKRVRANFSLLILEESLSSLQSRWSVTRLQRIVTRRTRDHSAKLWFMTVSKVDLLPSIAQEAKATTQWMSIKTTHIMIAKRNQFQSTSPSRDQCPTKSCCQARASVTKILLFAPVVEFRRRSIGPKSKVRLIGTKSTRTSSKMTIMMISLKGNFDEFSEPTTWRN